MNRERTTAIDVARYIFFGAVTVLVIVLMFQIPVKNYDRYYVEIRVVKKEIREVNGEDVYLLHCEDRDRNSVIYEIAKEAIGERFEEDEVYKTIRTGKYYKFRVAKIEEFDSHYPCICGAVKLIDGFSEETEAQGK